MKLTKKQTELRQRILDQIYARGPISRIDIAHNTGITPATTSDVTGHLIQEGFIQEIGQSQVDTGRSGRKKIMLAIANGHAYYVGAELTARSYTFCITDDAGKAYVEKTVTANASYDPEVIRGDVFAASLRDFIADNASYRPVAVGIALPGHFVPETAKIATINPTWSEFKLQPTIDAIDLPLYFENNVHCMALTERLLGPDQTDDNFIFLHAARGLFASVMYRGHLYSPENALVGEIGHTIVNPNGELCDCGRHGCLQTYASQEWIVKKARLLYRNADHTFLRQLSPDVSQLDFETVLKAYELGDDGVIDLLDTAIKYIAITVNNLALEVDARRIIIHGRIFDPAALQTKLSQTLNENMFQLTPVTPQRLTIKPYTQYNGAIAASMLAVSEQLLGTE